ncbi:MAG: hypothetical protein ABIY55_08140 [Kofleriaceae bacterium]
MIGQVLLELASDRRELADRRSDLQQIAQRHGDELRAIELRKF